MLLPRQLSPVNCCRPFHVRQTDDFEAGSSWLATIVRTGTGNTAFLTAEAAGISKLEPIFP